ncbi:uncharacterized protein [Phaseolus vulgaris]|uniref:uncharacterized protein n=1 Tax=Phaseolus vulgaris TaxID=3885 RepID=UPI0035CA2D94
MIIINLNIIGLGGGTKARYLSHLVSKEGADFLCLQETKTSSFSDARCFLLWRSCNIGWVHHEGTNGAGSMLTMWNKEAFEYGSHVVGVGFIAIVGYHLIAKRHCVVVNVYAACNLQDKILLWEALTILKQSYQNLAWCLCGDFNVVRRPEERKGIRGHSSQKKEIEGFNNFIETNGWMDIPGVGKKFTWFKANNTTNSRLNRFMVSEEWLQIWSASKQYVQQRVVSDHCALVLKSCVKDWGPKPFRTLDVWLKEPGFTAMIKDKWESYQVEGNRISVLKEKLKLLKADLKEWNKSVLGCVESDKIRIEMEIENLDGEDDIDALEDEGRLRMMDLLSQLGLVNRKLDSIYRQKARVN